MSIPIKKLLNTLPYKEEIIESEELKYLSMKLVQQNRIITAIHNDSPIANFIAKKGEGIHQIAFEVENILAEIERFKKEGFIVLNEIAKKGTDNKLVAFSHPKSANGVLIELCQEIK